MAFIRANSGGGDLSETTLWTNPNPSASFSAQTVTLSQSITNFKYIAFTYARNIDSLSDVHRVIYPVSDVQKWATSSSEVNKTYGMIIARGSSGNSYNRPIFYASDTTINFRNSTLFSNSTIFNGSNVPLAIIGMK